MIGNKTAALCLETLGSRGITHVLNMAQGEGAYRVDTDADYYANDGITFKGVAAEDAHFYDIAAHFEETSDFIETGLANVDGKVFVHCREGFSRAPTAVCAYLMSRKGMHLLEALKMVNERRKICPNMGFMEQLIELEERLNHERLSS